MVLLFACGAAFAEASDVVHQPEAAADYLLATPQIEDPLKPLAGLNSARDGVQIDAAVVTLADPLETRLGRVFDIQIASIIRAFHAREYVLDGYAFTWKKPTPGNEGRGTQLPVGGTIEFDSQHRQLPSTLVFRLDNWRDDEDTRDDWGPGVTYSVLFLVSESPTFGIQPKAFMSAAACADALNGLLLVGLGPPAILQHPCDKRSSDLNGDDPGFSDDEFVFSSTLQVIGPTFSGSMQSLALGIATFSENLSGPDIRSKAKVNVVSPSATVKSNVRVEEWALRQGDKADALDFEPLGANLMEQLVTLCTEVVEKVRDVGNPFQSARGDPVIVFLVEESTFGAGIQWLTENWPKEWEWEDDDKEKAFGTCIKRIRVTQFPQNISAIRAEESAEDQKDSFRLRGVLKSRGELLALDISGLDEASDRPPAYHPKLSSRSDQLMLYGTFDALRVWVEPTIVAIVATDVRDRLFLLNEVRKNLPTALPVLLEMDFLMTHPDYRKISRGAVVIPNGETLITIHRPTRAVTRCKSGNGGHLDYYAFPSDYAANLFRAVLNLIDDQRGIRRRTESDATCRSDACYALSENKGCDLAKCLGEEPPNGSSNCRLPEQILPPENRSAPFVTTLAGFQKVVMTNSKARPQSRLLAADSRLSMELPVYSLLLVLGALFACVGVWILRFGYEHLVMMSPLRNLNPRRGVKEQPNHQAEDPTMAPGDVHKQFAGSELPQPMKQVPWAVGGAQIAAGGILLLGLLIILLASRELVEYFTVRTGLRDLALPHGRHAVVLYSLFLAYLAIAGVGVWRLSSWRRRYRYFMGSGDQDQAPAAFGPDIGHDSRRGFGLVAALALFGLLFASVWARGMPTAVDNLVPSLVTSLFLLSASAWFLVEFWTEAKRWSRFAMVCGQTMDCVSKAPDRPGCRTDAGTWPSPLLLGELPQSPFSLQFRKRDMDSLSEPPDDLTWAKQTKDLSEGRWPFADNTGNEFQAWQSRLVAEMRYGAVAVRSAAWCGILAPTTVLFGMSVYPPVNERLQTSASVALIGVGFALIMYVVLRLEKHPLLGRMFTQNGDKLSIGGAFGALWPKVIAALVVLVPVLFPDFLDWVYGLLRSIDSLQ